MTRLVLLVITDGRLPYLTETMASAAARLRGPRWAARIIVDDSADVAHRTALQDFFPDWARITHRDRLGFAAAVRTGWDAVITAGATHVLHLEEDFAFNQPIDLSPIAAMLDAHPELAQIALKRQPVNPLEEQAGGLMETKPPETWVDRDGYVEHTLNFTTNPCLIPAHAIRCALASPRPLTEPVITDTLLAAGYRFAYLGQTVDPPRVTHIGEHRTGGWMQ